MFSLSQMRTGEGQLSFPESGSPPAVNSLTGPRWLFVFSPDSWFCPLTHPCSMAGGTCLWVNSFIRLLPANGIRGAS